MRSLRDALDGHHNSLGVLRLCMAAAVIFDHAFPLGGWGTAPFLAMTNNQHSLGGVAVLGFLGISGYLVTKSAQHTDVMQFIWRRFLRIFPGYWLALVIGAGVVGPVIWMLDGRPLVDYFGFGPGSPLAYLYQNALLTIGQYQIWDIYVTTTPFGQAGSGGPINGSIWTLKYEWLCYLLLAGLLVVGVIARAKIIIPIITAFFLLMQVVNGIDFGAAGVAFPFFADPWRLTFGFIFFVGASIALYADKIPFDHRFGIAAGLGALVLLRTGGFNSVGMILFAYAILYVAAALPRSFQWIGAKNDYSYGVYLYGWVVQQVLSYLGVNGWGYVPYVMISLVLATTLAWLSWHGVEKRALMLKDWGPGRGIRYWIDNGPLRRQSHHAAEAAQ